MHNGASVLRVTRRPSLAPYRGPVDLVQRARAGLVLSGVVTPRCPRPGRAPDGSAIEAAAEPCDEAERHGSAKFLQQT